MRPVAATGDVTGFADARNTIEFDCAGLETVRRVEAAGTAWFAADSDANSAGGGRYGMGASSALTLDRGPLDTGAVETATLFRRPPDFGAVEALITNAPERRGGGGSAACLVGFVEEAAVCDVGGTVAGLATT